MWWRQTVVLPGVSPRRPSSASWPSLCDTSLGTFLCPDFSQVRTVSSDPSLGSAPVWFLTSYRNWRRNVSGPRSEEPEDRQLQSTTSQMLREVASQSWVFFNFRWDRPNNFCHYLRNHWRACKTWLPRALMARDMLSFCLRKPREPGAKDVCSQLCFKARDSLDRQLSSPRERPDSRMAPLPTPT